VISPEFAYRLREPGSFMKFEGMPTFLMFFKKNLGLGIKVY